MNDALKLILSLSLSGSILALILFAIKPFIKHRLSKTIQYYIWIVVLLRLISPFSFQESIMNKVFYDNSIHSQTFSKKEIQSIDSESFQQNTFYDISNAEEHIKNEAYNFDADHNRYFKDIFQRLNHHIFYIYLLGAIATLTINTTGYLRFLNHLKPKNKNATDKENLLLNSLANGKNKIRLLRNPLVNTPMLIGIFKPGIIIPDREYNEKQLKNILHHEIIHLRRFDIVIKWAIMITKSIHWFNPMVYIIGKEINHACELSCDEAVIKNLSNEEKQEYGDTLISIVAENEGPIGILQATMSEDKNTLKDRLIAIMNYSKKSNIVIFISGILLLAIIVGGLYLGVGVRKDKYSPTSKIEEGTITTNIPAKPPSIIITNETDLEAIEVYTILKTKWNGSIYDRTSFYKSAWSSVPSILTGLHRLVPEEEITVDFGDSKPDNVVVKMAYLTESYAESLLPIVDVSVNYHTNGIYKFKNPSASDSDIETTGRVFSIEATWGDNICEYVFASDGKFDNNPSEVKWIPVKLDMEKLEELQKTIDNGEDNSYLTTSFEFIDSIGFSSENANRIKIEHNSDNKVIRYEFEDYDKTIELRLIQPIKNGIDGIWAVNLYKLEQIAD
ncbi:M56 family metallopeptidase [Tissierella carlieri]|uniref:M56 family metallopeptidase n=1 Tax=Tissierella carlieri TaxID=689904 RepID=A0ABT1SG54_9FIRM|nr:M56 family metallopeptidase [Tissierella carlieri]MCQ4925379.1 M56 family metallopeptidase [Tissierella carlieri]